jgi:hypothetical protein
MQGYFDSAAGPDSLEGRRALIIVSQCRTECACWIFIRELDCGGTVPLNVDDRD